MNSLPSPKRHGPLVFAIRGLLLLGLLSTLAASKTAHGYRAVRSRLPG
jgi:hypothetical protein